MYRKILIVEQRDNHSGREREREMTRNSQIKRNMDRLRDKDIHREKEVYTFQKQWERERERKKRKRQIFKDLVRGKWIECERRMTERKTYIRTEKETGK